MRLTTFRDVIGHQRVLDLLEGEVASPANSYLFVGAGSVGKATVARRFAAALLCPEGAAHAETCSTCRRALTGAHPDLVIVEPQARQTLGVDDARAVVSQAVLTPVEAPRKVFLFEEAGSMTEGAANALLKTLEEPTGSTVFVLVAESEDDLPSTVASRCRSIHFGRVDEADLVAALTSLGIEADRAESIGRVAGGRPGLALSLANSAEAARFRTAWLSVPARLAPAPGEAFALAEAMLAELEPLLADVEVDGDDRTSRERRERDRRRARQTLLAGGLEILASWYVDAASLQLAGVVRNRDVPLDQLAAVSPERAVRNARLVLDAMSGLTMNLRPRLLLADLFARLAGEE